MPDDLSSLSLDQLIDVWPGAIKGELDRRCRRGGFKTRTAMLRAHYLDQPAGASVHTLPTVRTAGQLSAEESGLLEAVRTQYKKKFNAADPLLPWAGNWSGAPSTQRVDRECRIYIDYWNDWTEGWQPPRNISLDMVYAILQSWAAPPAAKRRAR